MNFSSQRGLELSGLTTLNGPVAEAAKRFAPYHFKSNLPRTVMPTRNELSFWRKALTLRHKASAFEPPNLIGVGAARSGTTSLYHLLRETSDIYMSPVKEIAYFSSHYDAWTQSEYCIFFDGGQDHLYRGEISPHYLHNEKTPERIFALNSDCRIIIQLRNPVQRTISHYRHHFPHHKNNDINDYFRKGINLFQRKFEPARFSHPVANMRQSLYFDAVKRYLGIFPNEQVKIILFDDIVDQGEDVCADLSSWLGIKLSRSAIKRVGTTNKHIGGDTLDPGIECELSDLFADDLTRSCELIGCSIDRLRA